MSIYAIAALISRYIAHDQLRNDADTLWHHAITLSTGYPPSKCISLCIYNGR